MRRPSARLLALALLGTLLALYGALGTLQWSASAQMTPAREDGERAHADPNETLERLMQRRAAVQGVTARGQTIADAPPFTTTLRIDELYYYPCSDCHEDEIPDPRVRELQDEHTDLVFEHGGGRFWCYTCHNSEGMNKLKSFRGEEISYDQSYLLCGQCHFQRQKDWYFGGHGKRAGMFRYPREVPVEAAEFDMSEREEIGTWNGERVLHICTDCHDAHSPSIKPFEPSPMPQARTGLARREKHDDVHVKIWDTMLGNHGGAE